MDKYIEKHRRAELGFKLKKMYWRQGIMTEAFSKVLCYGFEEMRVNRIEALVDPRNETSMKLLEKAGFKEEGVLRDYEFEKEEFIDLVMTSLLRARSSRRQSHLNERLKLALGVISELEQASDMVSDDELYQVLVVDHGLGEDEVSGLLLQLMRKGLVHRPRRGFTQICL